MGCDRGLRARAGGAGVRPGDVDSARPAAARYLPARPDLEAQLKEKGKADGRKGNMNAWPIETLVKNDVYVADAFGKIAQGTLIGDNLGTAIFNKTGTGVIFDGAARALDQPGRSTCSGAEPDLGGAPHGRAHCARWS